MNRFLRYALCEEAGEDAKPAGGEVFTREQVEQMIAEQVAGLKANNEALLSEKKEEARKRKEAEEQRQRDYY